MAKSLKQQLNEQLATQHVQQALNNIGLEQFQAAYDEWNKQQEGLANFEAQFNAWNEANPVQPPEPVKEAPVKVQKEIPTLQKSGLTQEQNLAFRKEKREKALQRIVSKREKEEKTNNAATNETLNRLDTMTQIDLAKTPSMEDKSAKWLDPSYKLTEDDKKDAAEYARAELDKFNYGSNRQPLLKTDEERQHYADMVNLLNKTNPVANAMTGVIKQPLNLARAVRDVGRSIGDQLTGLGAALGDKFGLTEGATQRHNEKVEAADNFFNQNDESMQRAYEGAKTQNPVATTVGEVGGQIGMYALTNPLFDSLGAAAGLGKAGSFALNQVGQNAQDLALDTLPTLNQYMSDGEISDEERKALLSGMGWNAAGNLIMGGAGAGIDAIRNSRAAKNAADAAFRANVSEGAENLAILANPEDVDNVVRNVTRQYEEAAQNIDDLAKQMPEVPSNNANVSETIVKKSMNKGPNKYPDGKLYIDDDNDIADILVSGSRDNKKRLAAYNEGKQISISNRDELRKFLFGDNSNYFDTVTFGKVSDRLADEINQVSNGKFDDLYGAYLDIEKGHSGHSFNTHSTPKDPGDMPLSEDALIAALENTNNAKVLKTNKYNSGDRTVTLALPTTDGHVIMIETVSKSRGSLLYRNGWVVDNQKFIDDFLRSNPNSAEGISPTTVRDGITPYESNITDAIPEVNKETINNFDLTANPFEGAAETTIESAIPKLDLPTSTQDALLGDMRQFYDAITADEEVVKALDNETVNAAFDRVKQSLFDYEEKLFKSTDMDEVDAARRAVTSARKNLERQIQKVDPTVKAEITKYKYGPLADNAKYYRDMLEPPTEEQIYDELRTIYDIEGKSPEEIERLINQDKAYQEGLRAEEDAFNQRMNDYLPEDMTPDAGDVNKIATEKSASVPGADPLQTFAEGPSKAEWKNSKARTNTIEKLGWGDQMPKEDFAYRVYSEAEQNADAVERYKNSKNVVADILNKNMEDYDELDVKTAYNEAQRLLDKGDRQSIAQAQMLMSKNAAAQRQSGRVVQASAEFTRNTAAGALGDAIKMEEDTIVNPWKTTHKKATEGNSRIAKALSDMGHKADAKVRPQLTHDQIKNGVIAELNKEVGSVEKYFNENDIEYLTQLAEDKSIPVWQITSEIEHKLKTGNWYSLDESLPVPQPTNKKLQNALNSLIETEVRQTEKAAPTLQQITEEVRNTLGKEAADFEGQFTDDDIDYLANLINNGATKEELANALNTKMATGSFGISPDTMNQVNAIFKEISRFDPNSKQFVEGQAEAYRLLANEVVGDATPLEKFEAWRYLAMLGNPKTMLRNFIGNQTFGVVTGVSNNLAALAEAGIDKGVKALGGEGIQRTKSILNPLKDADLIKASFDDADISRYRQVIGSKYEKMNADTLRRSKSVFNSKLLQFYEKVTDAGISDYKAVKNKFSTSLAGYLKANGYDTSIFKAEDELARLKNLGETRLLTNAEKANIEKLTKDVEALEKARDFALKQAEYAAFHEDNAVATALTRASTYLRTSDNKVLNGLGAMFEGIVPFKKTPMNVLKSGLEYSPLGAIDSIKKTGKLIYENTGKRAGNLADTYINKKGKEVAKTFASDVIDSWAKTLTGSGLTALGFYLYDKGILNSSDKDLKYQDQLEGKQNYSLTINGKTYTIDWAAPTAMPLLLGAEVAKVWRDSGNDVENWYDHLDEYLNAANRLADPLIETSMLQGVKDTLDTAANAAKYDENLNIPTLIGYNTLTGYLTQGIPTISGQIARTVDNTRRSTYTDKEGVAGTLEKQGRKLMNKIPGLSTLNEPYIDTYGREQANSPFGNPIANLGYQMASPGYLADINETPADTMARDVYEKSGKADNILPKWNSYFKDSEGKRVSPEDFTQASRVAGEVQAEVRNALANDDWFNGLSDADKTDIVNDINTIAANMGKSSIDPEFENSNKSYVAYKEGGLKGLMDHFKNRYASNVAKESGLNSSTKAAQAIKEDVLNGDTEAAQQKIDAATSLQDLGLTKPGPSATYYNAQSLIPGLTTEDFAKTYKAIDSDGNQGIKQDEVIAYLNKHNITSESEANKIWSAYGSSSWKSIPKLEDGTWKKKKK